MNKYESLSIQCYKLHTEVCRQDTFKVYSKYLQDRVTIYSERILCLLEDFGVVSTFSYINNTE